MTGYRADYLLDPPPEPKFTFPPDATDGERWVYFHLDAHNTCLYVGKTRNPEARTRGHELSSEWYDQIVSFIWFGPMPDLNAASVERELIAAEQPANNVQHTERQFDPRLQAARCEKRIKRLQLELATAERSLARLNSRLGSEVSA